MRLFIALNLPEPVRESLWQAVQPLRDLGFPVRWLPPEGIHLTLKFLGEVAGEREAELRAALARAGARARGLPLAIRGFGAFPDVRRPRAIWAGLAPEPALELLQHGIEREFAGLGFPTEGRAFRPHFTIGRAARDPKTGAFRRLEAALESLRFADTALAETVDLMRSTPQPGGAVYQVLHRERLV